MRIRRSAGFTLIELVMSIVLTALLMAVVAPFLVNLFQSYTASAAGADLASAAGPAVWQMQWDARNANHLNVTNACRLILRQPNATKIKYGYTAGTIIQILPSGAQLLLLAHVVAPGGVCPFTKLTTRLATYRFIYTGSANQGQYWVEGALSADGY